MTTHSHFASRSTLSRWRRICCSLLLLAAVAAFGATFAGSREPGMAAGTPRSYASGKIAPWVMEHTANGQQAEFFVVLADQADLSQAANLRTKAEKGRYVYNSLLTK